MALTILSRPQSERLVEPTRETQILQDQFGLHPNDIEGTRLLHSLETLSTEVYSRFWRYLYTLRGETKDPVPGILPNTPFWLRYRQPLLPLMVRDELLEGRDATMFTFTRRKPHPLTQRRDKILIQGAEFLLEGDNTSVNINAFNEYIQIIRTLSAVASGEFIGGVLELRDARILLVGSAARVGKPLSPDLPKRRRHIIRDVRDGETEEEIDTEFSEWMAQERPRIGEFLIHWGETQLRKRTARNQAAAAQRRREEIAERQRQLAEGGLPPVENTGPRYVYELLFDKRAIEAQIYQLHDGEPDDRGDRDISAYDVRRLQTRLYDALAFCVRHYGLQVYIAPSSEREFDAGTRQMIEKWTPLRLPTTPVDHLSQYMQEYNQNNN